MTRRSSPVSRVPTAAPDYSCALAANGFLARAGAALQEATGRSAETLTSRPLAEFVHEADRATLAAALEWPDADGEPIVFEVRVRHADGTYRWFEWTVAGSAGDEVRRASFRDVTRWKRDEALALAHARALEAILADQPLADTLGAVAGVLDALGTDCHAAVHVLDEDGACLRLAWAATMPDPFRRALEKLAVPGGPGAAVAAAQDRKLVATPDLALETHWRGRRELPLAHGLRAEWAMPAVDAQGVLRGTVTVFHVQPALPLPRDRQVLTLAAQLLVAALDRGASRDAAGAEQARLEAELHAAERRHGEQVRGLERRLDDSAEALRRLQAELGHLEENLHRAQREAHDAQQARLVHEATADALRHAAAEESRARAALARRMAELEAEVAAERERAEAGRRELESERARLAAAEREAVERAERQDAALADAWARLGESEGALRESRDALAAALAELAATRAALAEAEARRDAEGAASREQLEQALWRAQHDAETYRAWADAEIGMLGLRVAEFDGIRAGLERALAEATDAVARARAQQERVRALEAELASAGERLAAEERRRADADAAAREGRMALEELPTLRAQLAMAERQRAELEMELADLRDRAPASLAPADVDEDLAALSARLAEAESTRQRLEGELAEARREAEDARRALEWERARCTEENDRLAQRLADVEARRATATATPAAPRAAWMAEPGVEPAAAEPETLDLSGLVERMRGELAAMLPGAVELHVRLTPHLPPVAGDAAQLRQMVAHLMSNAMEALEGRRGVISVGTGVVDADRPYLKSAYFDDGLPEGRYAFLEVSDTGHGMTPDVQRHLFDPGFSTRAPGRGRGLPQVLALVRAHGGAIQVYTKPEVGTTIRVLLPVANTRPRRGDASPASDSIVLVVDRDESMRAAAARILERWGFTVLAAADFQEGAELLREADAVRLVLLEANLPAPAGPATRALRELRADLCVLLAGDPNGSGNGTGASAVVARPFAPVELVAAVREALGRHGA